MAWIAHDRNGDKTDLAGIAARVEIDPDFDLDTCSGLPLRFVDANSSN